MPERINWFCAIRTRAFATRASPQGASMATHTQPHTRKCHNAAVNVVRSPTESSVCVCLCLSLTLLRVTLSNPDYRLLNVLNHRAKPECTEENVTCGVALFAHTQTDIQRKTKPFQKPPRRALRPCMATKNHPSGAAPTISDPSPFNTTPDPSRTLRV